MAEQLLDDPIAEWLESLLAWDGMDRVEKILHGALGADDNSTSRWASRSPFDTEEIGGS